jgi:hypothetical protein
MKSQGNGMLYEWESSRFSADGAAERTFLTSFLHLMGGLSGQLLPSRQQATAPGFIVRAQLARRPAERRGGHGAVQGVSRRRNKVLHGEGLVESSVNVLLAAQTHAT